MAQIYTVPSRESNPYSLPDAEVFYMDANAFQFADVGSVWADMYTDALAELAALNHGRMLEQDAANSLTGWYYWVCLPGCLPDSDPIGPFESEDVAIDDARSEAWQFEDESEAE